MTAEIFAQMSSLDRLVHEPARLAILTALSACRRADFMYLLRLTGLTRGNLSAHLQKLEAGGLVRVEKRFVGRRPNTLVSLSGKGGKAIDRHWRRLDELRRGSQGWSPDGNGSKGGDDG